MAAVPEVRIGVLAFRDVQSTQTAWQPTVDYLNSQIREYHFTLHAMYFPDMDRAVRQQEIDLLLTNPGRYIVLEAEFGIDAIATLIRLESGHPVNKFGSVIFIAGNIPLVSEITPLLIITKLEQYDVTGATAIAVVMLLIAFVLLLGINLLQAWARRRQGAC